MTYIYIYIYIYIYVCVRMCDVCVLVSGGGGCCVCVGRGGDMSTIHILHQQTVRVVTGCGAQHSPAEGRGFECKSMT